jgi:hypothetical protein
MNLIEFIKSTGRWVYRRDKKMYWNRTENCWEVRKTEGLKEDVIILRTEYEDLAVERMLRD